MAHLTPYLQQETQRLESRLLASQQHNTQMMEHIQSQRAEMERLVSGLEAVVKDIEASVESMQVDSDVRQSQLREEIWQMEQEIQASR